ncbi:MAG TPA: AMIN domain-containing protein [Candidatus Acidoferrales bacterium]|nr:AMIN domain-containing protein [Candidatus Acidoferrales bacterium]
MDTKRIFADRLRLIAGVLVFCAVAGYWLPRPMFAALLVQASRTNSQLPAESAAGNAATIVIAKVSVSRQRQNTIVSVTTSGIPVYQATHLTDPERVVLDFQRARLAIPATTPSSYGPVFRVRAAQFKPDVVRVVVDLQEAFPYKINLEENTVAVEFGAAEPAPKPSLSPGPSSGASEPSRESPAAEPSTVTPAPPAPPPLSPMPSRSARVPAKSEPQPIEPVFSNGMLTFRVQNETLRSALARISTQSGIAIYMGNDLGNEPLSMEFRHYRIDEALRQILKDYDTFFFYGGDDGNQAATSLKAIWVYPEGRGPRFASFK